MDNQLLYFETHEQDQNSQWILLVHGAGGSTRTWKRQIESLGAKYNLLVVDLPGHGANAGRSSQYKKYSFEFVANKIWEVIDHLKIKSLHIVGVSLGTVICLKMRSLRPDYVRSVIMPGAIVQLNTKLRVIANLSLTIAKVIGFRNLYSMSAHIMMPRKNHKKSRDVFITESLALTNEEFKKWTDLYYHLNATLKKLFVTTSEIPHLLIMGDQDHLFLGPSKKFVKKHSNALLSVIPKCGHVVSIEQAQKFNDLCLKFLANVTVNPNVKKKVSADLG